MSKLRTQFMDKSKRLYRMTRQQTTRPPIRENRNRSRWLKQIATVLVGQFQK